MRKDLTDEREHKMLDRPTDRPTVKSAIHVVMLP